MTEEEKKAIEKLKKSANYFVMPLYAVEIIINLIEKQQEENTYLKTFLYIIRDMTQEVLIVKGDKPGTYRPIKNTRRHEVYETMVKIKHFLYGEYFGLDHKSAIQKKIIECLGEGEKNENS